VGLIKLNSFILGLLFAVVLFVVIGVVFYLGYRLGNKGKPSIPQQTEDEDNEIKRLDELQKGFVKLMNYDVSTALTRKKV
jgi:hypothetical protein